MKERPLISFVLTCYRQEKFIRESVAGALAQTYSPLEIIVSDDGSPDRTFDIVREIVAGYHGPHTVRLNRNETNLGIGGNVNRAMELCRGELVVIAAGDDVSLPERTELTWRAWEESGRQATSVCSSYTTIYEDGAELGRGGFRGAADDTRPVIRLEGDLAEFLATRQPTVCGCSHAWTPELFRYFGPLQSDLEDLVLSFRSLAMGQMIYLRQPLVKYRRHTTNVSFFAGGDDTRSFAHRENRLRWVGRQTVKAYDNMLADIDVLHRKGRLNDAERDRLQRAARRVREVYAIELNMLEGGFLKKLGTLAGALARGNILPALRFSPRLVPGIYRLLYEFRNRQRFPMPASTRLQTS